MRRALSQLKWLLVVLAGALVGGIAPAEDEACARRADDKGLMGKERTQFMEECERLARGEAKTAPGVETGKNRPGRRDRDTSRERTSRDHDAAPAVTP